MIKFTGFPFGETMASVDDIEDFRPSVSSVSRRRVLNTFYSPISLPGVQQPFDEAADESVE